ncbi:MAG: branched-chain amino acid ABC transporter permease, partial [Nocardioidaceae bacterium]|nr:branched-chain amino acid ABC transporter permease [Nocardioidaceae bacterium]
AHTLHGFNKTPPPGPEPLAGVRVEVTQDDEPIGEATTDKMGAWSIDLPSAGEYDVTVDLSTLPKKYQPRREGGEVLPGVVVRPNENKTVLFPLIGANKKQAPPAGSNPTAIDSSDSGSDTPITTKRVLQLTVEGIKLGAIIAITAIGLSLVFGTTRLINFAHGELVTLGAVSAYWLSTSPGHLPLILATVVTVGIGALAGAFLERGLWRPVRRRGSGLIQMFIISIGVSLLVRHLILIYFGSRRPQYSDYAVQSAIHIGPVSITPRDLTVVVLSALVLVGVAAMLQFTRIGKAMRAVADNKDLAATSGINVDRVTLWVWMIGGGLAALGGVFYGLTSKAVYWDMGFNLLLLMFAGVILGGLGSAYGAMLGSLVVGLVAQLSTLWFPVDLQNAWALLVLIVVLLIRPQGILGRAERAG